MDAETFMGPGEAVKHGFADIVDEGIEAIEADAKAENQGLMARRQTEAALARAGFSRNDRSRMMQEMGVGARRDASPTTERDAGVSVADVQRLIETLKN